MPKMNQISWIYTTKIFQFRMKEWTNCCDTMKWVEIRFDRAGCTSLDHLQLVDQVVLMRVPYRWGKVECRADIGLVKPAPSLRLGIFWDFFGGSPGCCLPSCICCLCVASSSGFCGWWLVTPRYLASSTIRRVVSWMEYSAFTILRLLVICRTSHLSRLKDICHNFSQDCRSSRSFWRASASSCVLMER